MLMNELGDTFDRDTDRKKARLLAQEIAVLLKSKVVRNPRVVLGEPFCPYKVPMHTREFYCSLFVSDVSFGVGLVGIAIGTYLIWATPASATSQTAKSPRVPMLDVGATSNGGQVSMRGVW